MSDRNERACTKCGSLTHHEDDCPNATFTMFEQALIKERDELRAEVEALKAEAERYAGWSRWKTGLWKITHPESGPSAEWIGEAQ